jgi:hypothetical protein
MIFLNRLSFEHTLYLLALALGLFVRFLQLGAAPISDFEAGWALQARALIVGEANAVGSNPAYILLTSLLFQLFGFTNFLARFWPALTVSLLVLLPVSLRGYIGKTAALIIAFGLALDPGLTAISRIAGGPGMAIGFSALALGGLLLRRPLLAGIMGGMALLSGPYIIHGLLVLFLTWLFVSVLNRTELWNLRIYDWGENGREEVSINHRKWIISLLGTLLLIGTLFFWFPPGIGGFAAILPDYLSSWLQPVEIPYSRLLAALVVYQLLILSFGVLGIIRSWRNTGKQALLGKWMSLWVLSAILLSMVYPGRQVWDIGWALVPLIGLAAIEISHLLYLRPPETSKWISITQAVFIFTLLAFSWIQISAVGTVRTHELYFELPTFILLILGAMIMIGMTSLLVGLGWSWRTTQLGIIWGFGAALLLYTISVLWGPSQLRMNRAEELWSPLPGTGQAHLLQSTLNNLSAWNTGHRHSLDVVALAETPSLRWFLLNWDTRFLRDIPLGELPSVIVTFEEHENPTLAASYRGQRFVWSKYPVWEGGLPQNWPRWLTNRDAPHQETYVVLWVRSDLFPGGTIEINQGLGPDLEETNFEMEDEREE